MLRKSSNSRKNTKSYSKSKSRSKSKSIRYGGSHVDGQPFIEFKMPSEYELESKKT
jgi:hypothetical protein